jgi:hypothetical protein
LEDNLGKVQPETGAQKIILAGGKIVTQLNKKFSLVEEGCCLLVRRNP